MNFRMTIAYDGARYHGWERQPGVDMTIQGKIETVLSRMIESEKGEAPSDLNVIAAGRTDAGVHARAMCANVHLDTKRSAAEIRAYLNEYLPEDISVDQVKECSERFHARYNAVGKTYRYQYYCGKAKPVFDRKYVTILERMPDVAKMREAAAYLCGEHDFKSFCLNTRTKKSTTRVVDEITIRQKGDRLTLEFHGNGFLRGMARILTGTLLEVGYGERKPDEMTAILNAKSRAASGAMAPAQGLTLIRVDY